MAQSGSSKKVANSLVAASAAAVLAVYAAGYARTRSAAEQLDAQTAERRPATPEGRGPAPSANEPRPAAPVRRADAPPSSEVYDWARDQGNAPAQIAVARPVPTPANVPAGATAPSSAQTALAAIQTVKPAEERKQVVTAAAPGATAPAPSVVAAVTPTPVASAPAVPAPAAPVATAASAGSAPPTPATPPEAAAAPKWKDGTYTGWGTCRHGDIQAEVVIESGRITSAKIVQCLTRYSCNVIGPLPPEVIQRQSAEVDYVSGATQSANAFYYAVVEALGKAK